MKGPAAASASRCIRRCQLLGGANYLYYSTAVASNLANNDGGTACCSDCYAAGYK